MSFGEDDFGGEFFRFYGHTASFYGQDVTMTPESAEEYHDLQTAMIGERAIRQYERVDAALEKKNKEARENIKKMEELSIMMLNLTRGMLMLTSLQNIENPIGAVAMAAFGIGSLGVSGYYGYTLSGGG